MCHRCATSGSWYDLKRKAGSGGSALLQTHDGRLTSEYISRAQNLLRTHANARRGGHEGTLLAEQRAAGLQPVPDQLRVRSYPANLMHNPRFHHVKNYLSGTGPGHRGIRPDVLIKYGVGCASYR